MKCSFCFLETDRKTYDYVRRYFVSIKQGNTTYPLDLAIQSEEILLHLEKNGFALDDQNAISEWIEENSANFRSYLNSLKMIAMFLHLQKCNDEDEFRSLFPSIVNEWNTRKLHQVDYLFS